ncbi:MAG: single-stranded-DNA-specific exonuclease RecJ, partial [bacterium]|nr:single-stranded-DNA-specific exonuclease RecJ [bacterium]
YDADAVTANAVMQQTFRYLNVEALSYIPDRFTEGYGMNVEAFEKIKELGVTLVITVDCGTNSVDVAEYCKNNGIDLIITDHHEITGETPDAYALVNPKNPAEHYPDTQITGVGVAYKFAKALLMQQEQVISIKGITPEEYQPEWDKWLLDLVAIGTVADCHSLLGENRILVKFGLRVLQKTKWIGLKQLVDNAGIDVNAQAPDSKTLGFTIAPRINAAGRLEHADIALQLLVTNDFAEAITMANRLEEINRRRQDLTSRIVSEAREQAELMSDRKVLLLHNESWPKGLVGIVAGKLAEQYGKPVIVLERGETEATGSGRTSGAFDLVECLKSVSHHLVKFGGHKQAAGLTAHTDKLDEMYLEILKYADEHWPEETSDPVLEIDAELREEDITLDSFDAIADLEPFGQGNPKPKFMINEAQVVGFKAVGATKQHLQLQVLVGQKQLDCIGFSMAHLAERLVFGSTVSLVGELMVDTWNGSKKLKMRLIDAQIVAVPEMVPETRPY